MPQNPDFFASESNTVLNLIDEKTATHPCSDNIKHLFIGLQCKSRNHDIRGKVFLSRWPLSLDDTFIIGEHIENSIQKIQSTNLNNASFFEKSQQWNKYRVQRQTLQANESLW